MSGLEIAGLAVGIVPIFLQVILGYRTTRETLQNFSSYSSSVGRLSLRAKTQEALFRNECRLLLRFAVDENQGSEMLEDPLHRLWDDEDTEMKLLMSFGDSYDAFKDNLTEIRERLAEINDEFSEYTRAVPPTALHLDNASDLFTQFKHKLKFASSEEKIFKRKLDEVRRAIRDVSQLRCQVFNFHEFPHSFSSASITRQKIPESFSVVRKASDSLHAGLMDAWTCSNHAHANHQAKLCLEAAVDIGVKLDLAIMCHRKCSPDHIRMTTEPPLWLYVQTDSSRTSQLPVAQHDLLSMQPADGQPATNGMAVEVTEKTNGSVFASINKVANDIGLKKRVRFEAHESQDRSVSAAERPPSRKLNSTASEVLCYSTFDIGKATRGICDHFADTIGRHPRSHNGSCLGFLETPNCCKLVFYDFGRPPADPSENKDIITINKILPGLSRSQQLNMALSIAVAVLRYHTTSWLPPNWHLHDLAFFGRYSELSSNRFSKQLETLHMSAEFPRDQGSELLTDNLNGQEASIVSAISDAELYGIRNLTLANLGIALLEIGLKKDIQQLRKTGEPHDVVTARKLAHGDQTPLGPEYQKIIRKCVDCDFAFGADLSTGELQDAVYSDVVCSLKDLIKAFESLGLE